MKVCLLSISADQISLQFNDFFFQILKKKISRLWEFSKTCWNTQIAKEKKTNEIENIFFFLAGRMVSKGNQQGLWRSWIASYLTFRPLLSHHSLRWRRSFGSRKIPIGKADACNREKSDESTAKGTWASSSTWEKKTVEFKRFSIFPIFQTSCHKLFHAILVNNSSRESALNFIEEVLVRNSKRQQLQVNERMVAGDGFMLNFLSVMQHLSAKVVIDKVDPFYLLSPKSRINISEDTRLNMTSKEASEWMEEFSKDPGFEWKEAKFPTECWYLTLYAHHLGILPGIRRYQKRLRIVR